jgi:hypothetical protein
VSFTLTPGQAAFINGVAQGTGLDKGVVTAWVYQEENGSAAAAREAAGNQNWLNIGPGRVYGSVQDAVQATIATLHNGLYSGVLASASQSPSAQIAAIGASPWDAGHYGGGGSILARTYQIITGKTAVLPGAPSFGGATASGGAGATGTGTAGTSGGGNIFDGVKNEALKGLLYLTAAIGGVGLLYIGVRNSQRQVAHA